MTKTTNITKQTARGLDEMPTPIRLIATEQFCQYYEERPSPADEDII